MFSHLSKNHKALGNSAISLTFVSAAVLLLAGLSLFPSSAYAADNEVITAEPEEGRVDDVIQLDGSGFTADSQIYFYFSSDGLDIGDNVRIDLINYEGVGVADIDKKGDLVDPHSFKIPKELDDGEGSKQVWNDTYYIYTTYRTEEFIIAKTEFTVIQGEIVTYPEEATVGSELVISGEKMRPNKGITITYDGAEVDIIYGDTTTDSNGVFSSTIYIPESSAGIHTVTAIDESGNRPETEFTVIPGITLEPSSQIIGGTIVIEGTGFARRSDVIVLLNENRITTTPVSLHTNQSGSFTVNIIVPYYAEYAGGETSAIVLTARDENSNSASAEFYVASAPRGIILSPSTSQSSPGHVGMELTVNGSNFSPESVISINYDDSHITSANADGDGNFTITFTIPQSAAGEHTVAVTDAEFSEVAPFIMESRPPATPVPLQPEPTTMVPPTTIFEWQDVIDPSGVSYTLQVSLERDFSSPDFEKAGLTESAYALGEDEELAPMGSAVPYYWRVKAIDGAFNESDWTVANTFYVANSSSLPAIGESRYILIAIAVGAFFFIYRMQHRKTS